LKAPPALAVDLQDKLDDATPLLHRVSPTSSLLRVAPSLCLASVLSSLWGCHLDFSLGIEAAGSHVPHKSLVSVHATSMPDVIQPGCRLPLDLSWANDSSQFRHRSYAFDTFPVVHSLRLPKPHLTRSRRAFSIDAHHPDFWSEQLVAVWSLPCRPARGALPHLLCSTAAFSWPLRPPFGAFVAHSRPQNA
jgi:hypothetical protein